MLRPAEERELLIQLVTSMGSAIARDEMNSFLPEKIKVELRRDGGLSLGEQKRFCSD